jgi:exosortase A-associated hydrolase 2
MQVAFFLDGSKGKVFCTGFVDPNAEKTRKCVLLVPPFAEEMNKTRHFYSRLSHRIRDEGCDVLMVDLFGTGDSEGSFEETSIDLWRTDLDNAIAYLQPYGELNLVGLRFGALLAADAAQRHAVSKLILLHPQISGVKQLDEVLRLSIASALVSGGQRERIPQLRQRLANGESLELAGYDVTAQLACGMDALDLEQTVPDTTSGVYWYEVLSDPGLDARSDAERIARKWEQSGIGLHFDTVACAPFWATRETTSCLELIDALPRILGE